MSGASLRGCRGLPVRIRYTCPGGESALRRPLRCLVHRLDASDVDHIGDFVEAVRPQVPVCVERHRRFGVAEHPLNAVYIRTTRGRQRSGGVSEAAVCRSLRAPQQHPLYRSPRPDAGTVAGVRAVRRRPLALGAGRGAACGRLRPLHPCGPVVQPPRSATEAGGPRRGGRGPDGRRPARRAAVPASPLVPASTTTASLLAPVHHVRGSAPHRMCAEVRRCSVTLPACCLERPSVQVDGPAEWTAMEGRTRGSVPWRRL